MNGPWDQKMTDSFAPQALFIIGVLMAVLRIFLFFYLYVDNLKWKEFVSAFLFCN